MRFALFCHSIVSDWNHGNAHFLRGLVRALEARGHSVMCYEQVDNWSLSHLLQHNVNAVADFTTQFPDIKYTRYALDDGFDEWLAEELSAADVVLMHEWNEPSIVRQIGGLCAQLGQPALFHDTHYRVTLDADYRSTLGLERYRMILAFSPSVADRYRALGFENVAVLHEAADTTVFAPLHVPKSTDVVFVGNYGDGDRSDELEDYIFSPRTELRDRTFAVYGVRYPDHVLARFRNGLDVAYGGWLPNVLVPSVYSAARVVLHVPRGQYVDLLPGTPTIRVFEALACGACLISLPWPDTDRLFSAGEDFAVADSPMAMRDLIRWLTRDEAAAERFGAQGRATVLARHTCGHRADELVDLVGGL